MEPTTAPAPAKRPANRIRVRTAMNGVEVIAWREADPTRVQLHAWTGPQEVLYKDIVVETFPKQNKLITARGGAGALARGPSPCSGLPKLSRNSD